MPLGRGSVKNVRKLVEAKPGRSNDLDLVCRNQRWGADWPVCYRKKPTGGRECTGPDSVERGSGRTTSAWSGGGFCGNSVCITNTRFNAKSDRGFGGSLR